MFVTGLISYAAYNPDLGPLNDQTPGRGLLGFYLFNWPTHPVGSTGSARAPTSSSG